ncbi:hypothetical protein [Limnofasciculus baicalensis]|nr:hypothetical protein [Limnofasciculus baicalensis]
MDDVKEDIASSVKDSLFASCRIVYPKDERWLIWIKSALFFEEESVALVFMDESTPYKKDSEWKEDLAHFLPAWTPLPKSYAHIFLIDDEGEASSELIEQTNEAFRFLGHTGYSFSVHKTEDVVTSIERGGGGTSFDHKTQGNPRKPVATRGAINRFLDTIEGGYRMEVFSAPSFNVADILAMKANNQPIPDWMFRGPILTEMSSQAIDVEFECNSRCPIGSFEIESNTPPECFPYQVAIDSIRELNKYLFQLEGWKL